MHFVRKKHRNKQSSNYIEPSFHPFSKSFQQVINTKRLIFNKYYQLTTNLSTIYVLFHVKHCELSTPFCVSHTRSRVINIFLRFAHSVASYQHFCHTKHSGLPNFLYLAQNIVSSLFSHVSNGTPRAVF